LIADKGTEIDLPLLRVEDTDASSSTLPANTIIMSQITGVKPLQTKTGESIGELPRFGVDVSEEDLLSEVNNETSSYRVWKSDI